MALIVNRFVALLAAAFAAVSPLDGATDGARAQADVSLGTLICSVGGTADITRDELREDTPFVSADISGPAYRVACSFQGDGGAEEAYAGTIYLKQGDRLPTRPMVWTVRGLKSFDAEAGVLARSYTLRAPRAEGAGAALVPKDTEDTSLGLYRFAILRQNSSESATVTGIELVLRHSLA